MKICLDARFKVKSGSSSYVLNLIPKILQQRSGHTFILLKYATQKFDFEDQMELVVSTPESDFAHVLWTFLVLPVKLRQWNVDVYHSMKIPGPFWMGARTVNTMHSIFEPYKGSFPVSIKTKIYTILLVNTMIRHSHRLIAVSEFVSDSLQKVYGMKADRLDVIYNAVADEIGKRPQEEIVEYLEAKDLPEKYTLCVGNIFTVKNHITAVRAFAHSSIPENTHLIIAGRADARYAASVVSEIEKLGLQDKVHLLGFVSGNDLTLLLNGAYCMLFPSLTEGCSVTLLEAFKCGLPVIASKRGGLWEIGQHVAVFVEDPMDYKGFAAELTKIYDSESLRESLSNAVLVEAENFSWEKSAKAHLATYAKALKSN